MTTNLTAETQRVTAVTGQDYKERAATSRRATGDTRRAFLAGAAAAMMTATGAGHAFGQEAGQATTRRYERDAQPVRYPDPDIVILDPRFAKYRIGNTPIQRLYTGMLWAEGPAWNSVGRFVVWSDIPNNVQHRRIDEDGHISVFRNPSNQSNGNTFDWQGRQLSCEHATRRVVRYEHDGTTTVLAEKWQGKPFNAPNDIVVHPDGGIWFTDPGYGSLGNYEGFKGALEIKEAVYRIDGRTGRIEKVTDEIEKPNGLCFSHDYKRLFIADTGSAKNIKAWDVTDNATKLRNGREFHNMKQTIGGQERSGVADGLRADKDGNIWVGAGGGGDGYDGVHCITPDGQRIGQIRLPEVCSNLVFGGARRNRLFITASQSLYAVYVETQGAHIS